MLLGPLKFIVMRPSVKVVCTNWGVGGYAESGQKWTWGIWRMHHSIISGLQRISSFGWNILLLLNFTTEKIKN